MREIKFRAKRMDSNEWLFGSLFVDKNKHCYIKEPNGKLYFIENKDTIGQFTGLKDKNGKEIYEGDIVRYTRRNIRSEYFKKDVLVLDYQIYWNEDQHTFGCSTKFESGGGASGCLNFVDERAETNEIEVIGNTYDNPELLKAL